jgi:hypothetical protein
VGRKHFSFVARPMLHSGRVTTFHTHVLALPLLLASLAACPQAGEDDDEVGEEGEDEVADEGEPSAECLSGTQWVGGNEESPLMNPGQDCLACHSQMGVEEEFVLAGTVFGASNEPDNCFGEPGVTVQITDSTSKVFELTSNASGNFALNSEELGAITPPYSAKLLFEGRERIMLTMQTQTSCNSCHTQSGLNGAPGRILAP